MLSVPHLDFLSRPHKSAIALKKLILTIGAVVVVLTAPYLSDSGGSGIITPLLFIKLTNQTNSENKTIAD